MKKLFVVLAILFVGILLAGCTSQPSAPVDTPTPTPVPTTAPPMKSIVDTAVADGRFTTLVSALQAANLTETLNGTQVYTIFAPTDDAFKKLPNGTVATKDILLYHVVAGKVTAAEVVTLTTAKTVQGSNLTITVTNDSVKVNNANIIATDIATTNGVIHVIDTVLIPPAPVPTATATPTATPTPQPSATITFTKDMRIMPSTTVYIPVGGKVIWKNEDDLKPHGIAAVDGAGAKYFGGMTGFQIPYGTTKEVTFDTVGSFDYKTTFQPETTGRIVVTK